ncbi:MAG: (d)CMP kinase, partial [Planctomycetota bacterium]
DALPEIRARRRAKQLREAGREVDETQLLIEIVDRDRLDSTRTDGPLLCADDAERLDTSTFRIEQVVDELEVRARKRLDDLDASYLL